MSIIGPRPLLVSYLPWYTEEEKQRHDVRPGLSGLAQVNGRNSVTWEEKFSWDLKYVDRITFLGDVKISAYFLGFVLKIILNFCFAKFFKWLMRQEYLEYLEDTSS